MPVYNCGVYIKEAIASILNQTYQSFEFIIIDDGSTDNTFDLISSFNDSRIKCTRLEHKGITYALNYGISQSTCDLVARMDADDIANEERLLKQYNFLKQNTNVHIVGTNFDYIDEFKKKVFYKKFPEYHKDIAFSMPIVASVLHPTILTYKKVLLDVGNYSRKYSHIEDQELFLRLISRGYKMYNIQESLYLYRIRNDNQEKHTIQRKNTYVCGYRYLKGYYAEKNSKNQCYEKNLRFGLLEYYYGSIPKARKHFLECMSISPLRFKKVLRYLPFTFLGEKILNSIRTKGISAAVNRFLIKTFNMDTYRIRS